MEPHAQTPPTPSGTSGLPPRTSDDPPITIEVLEPGLVHIKNALGRDAQVALAEVAMARGNHPTDGFWRPAEDGAPRVLNCSVPNSRGRVFDAIGRFPAAFVEACAASVRTARAADPHMPAMDPTHLLMVYYESGRGIFWHKDNARNDGRNDHPVVSFSLGNRCSFSVLHNWSYAAMKERKGEMRTIILESGDALLFGGACRYIHHSVTGVKRNTAPPWLPMLKDKRLNLTFRDAPEVAGEEHTTYKYFTPSEGKKKSKKRLRVEDVGAGPSSQETVAEE